MAIFFRKRQFLWVLGLAVGSLCFSQDLCSLSSKGRGLARPSYADAYAVLDTIGRVVPFETRTIKLFPSSDALVKQRGGAAAQLCGNISDERWIFFDPDYIDAIKPHGGESDLPRYFVLAHEAAHHINGDTLVGNKWSKDQELAADYAAAVWLTRLEVTNDELLQTFDALGFPRASVDGYPSRAERRASVIRGSQAAGLPPTPAARRDPEHNQQLVPVTFCPGGNYGFRTVELTLTHGDRDFSVGSLDFRQVRRLKLSSRRVAIPIELL